MGFGQIDTWTIPTLENYAAALKHYRAVVPIRGSDNIRPIQCRRKQHMRIHMLLDQSIACRLYNTDVVVYHPDNSITVESWSSRSTDDFANAVLPSGISPRFTAPVSAIQYVDAGEPLTWMFVNASEPVTFKPSDSGRGWTVTSDTEPFKTYRLDRKLMNAARKASGLADFEAWLKAYRSIGGAFDARLSRCGQPTLDYLKEGVEGYLRVMYEHSRYMDVTEHLRTLVIREYGCVVVTTKPRLSPYEFNSAMSSQRRLAHLVSL